MDIAVTQAKIFGLISEAFAISEDESSLNLMRGGIKNMKYPFSHYLTI